MKGILQAPWITVADAASQIAVRLANDGEPQALEHVLEQFVVWLQRKQLRALGHSCSHRLPISFSSLLALGTSHLPCPIHADDLIGKCRLKLDGLIEREPFCIYYGVLLETDGVTQLGAEANSQGPKALPSATDEQVRQAIRFVYKCAEHPPNLAEVWPLVSNALHTQKLHATKQKVQNLAEDTEFASQRSPSGQQRSGRRKLSH